MERKTPEYYIRTFRDGDEEEIIRLFEECYSKYAGYVARTPRYWRWCCLDRPDVERGSVFVAVRRADEKIAGYAVVGKSGNIWELGYDHQGKKNEIVQLLLDAATSYLMDVGASSVNLQVPAEDDVVGTTCANLGFAENKSPDVFVSVLDFQKQLLLLASIQAEQLKHVNEKVRITLKDAPPWMSNKFGIKIKNGTVEALNGNQKSTISIKTDVSTLSSLLFGVSTPFSTWVRRKVVVKPFWKIWSFFRLFSVLCIKESWFIPLSDYG